MTNNKRYVASELWPIRIKILLASGRMQFTLNRVQYEYDYSDRMNNLHNDIILNIQPSQITNIITPLNI